MKTEYEIRILDVNKEEMIKKLEKLGATLKGEFEQKRYVYDLKPVEKDKWIRLRTNGNVTTLTYKNIVSNTIDGTKEVEFEVEDFNNTFRWKLGNLILLKLDKNRSYQENERIQYILSNVEIDIDSWPMIPTYMEIEGKSEEEIINMKKVLDIDEIKVTTLNCDDIYKQIYKIDISKIKELKF